MATDFSIYEVRISIGSGDEVYEAEHRFSTLLDHEMLMRLRRDAIGLFRALHPDGDDEHCSLDWSTSVPRGGGRAATTASG